MGVNVFICQAYRKVSAKTLTETHRMATLFMEGLEDFIIQRYPKMSPAGFYTGSVEFSASAGLIQVLFLGPPFSRRS